MPVYVDEKFIVYPGEDELDLLDVLSGGSDDKPFDTNAELYVYCASLAKVVGKKAETKNRASKGEVAFETFVNKNLHGVVFAIALDETQDLRILRETADCYKIFESYVNGGLSSLQKKAKNFTPEELITSMMNELRTFSQEHVPDDDEIEEGSLDIE
tara:strand:- start:67 stop:537 length:471 start_codon:yes stop_codon:yes gene_type:complete